MDTLVSVYRGTCFFQMCSAQLSSALRHGIRKDFQTIFHGAPG